MRITDLLRVAALFALTAVLAACASTAPTASGPEIGRAGGIVVAKVQPGETAESLARRYVGRAGEGWRVSALDGGALQPGEVAVVSLDAPAGGPQGRVPILCYHHFTSASRSRSSMEVTAADLDGQMKWLKDNGYTVVRLSDLASFLRGETRLPAHAVVITVDDGHRSLRDVAFPVFSRYGAPFTAFVVTDYIGKAGLSWEDLKRMRESGLGDIESHSKSHPDLRRKGKRETFAAYQQRLKSELDQSRRLVAERVGGAPPRFFAYPYGAADSEVLKEVHDADYALALTVERGGNDRWADPLLLHRDMIYGSDGVSGFVRRLQSAEAGGRR